MLILTPRHALGVARRQILRTPQVLLLENTFSWNIPDLAFLKWIPGLQSPDPFWGIAEFDNERSLQGDSARRGDVL